MKRILSVLIIILLVASCTKSGTPVTPSTPSQTPTPQNPNPNPSNTTARFIPNWNRDTLHAALVDANGNFVLDTATLEQLYDTIITYSINDTSFVEYSGIRYYLWWEAIAFTDTFVNNSNSYGNCMLSLSTAPKSEINQFQLGAAPYRYWNTNLNTWSYQRQLLMGFDFYVYHKTNPKYEAYLGYYQSIN